MQPRRRQGLFAGLIKLLLLGVADQGYFDLYGRFHGPQLVMDARAGYAGKFRSGLKFDHASASLAWSGYSDFKSACRLGSAHP